MVPGIANRERLLADTRRLEWLIDAEIGPAGMRYESELLGIVAGSNPASRSNAWLRHLASRLTFEKHLRIGVIAGPGSA